MAHSDTMKSPPLKRQHTDVTDDYSPVYNEHGVRINEPTHAEKIISIHDQLQQQLATRPPFKISDVLDHKKLR